MKRRDKINDFYSPAAKKIAKLSEPEEEEDYESKLLSHQEKRQNLKDMIRWICSLPSDYSFSSSFDVLRGKRPGYYGLSPGTKGEIILSLLIFFMYLYWFFFFFSVGATTHVPLIKVPHVHV